MTKEIIEKMLENPETREAIAGFLADTWREGLSGSLASQPKDLSTSTPQIPLVPFSTGTDEEIFNIIQSYYLKQITLEEIKSVWRVGDARKVKLNHSKEIEIVILDFDHDELYIPIRNIKKALLTVQTKELIMTSKYNNDFKAKILLPLTYQANIKTVRKYTNGPIVEMTPEDYFLLSEKEVFGEIIYSNKNEDFYNKQYEYYENKENRIKNATWWLRSPHASISNFFCYVSFYGNANYYNASYTRGLAPAFCL